jgi:hypothetical protein
MAADSSRTAALPAPMGALGPAVTVTQLASNAACLAQTGGRPVFSGKVAVRGGRVYAFYSASGWSASGSTALAASLTVATEVSSVLGYANPKNSHQALTRQRVALGHLAPGPATPVTLTAAGSTTTDTSDRVSLTVVELGLPASWRQLTGSSGSASFPPSSYVTLPFTAHGGNLMISGSGTGFSTNDATMTGMTLAIDGASIGNIQLFANQANWHLPFVPADFLVSAIAPGAHTFTATPMSGTRIDGNDFYSVSIIEILAPPAVLNVTPALVNASASTQPGGQQVCSGSFSSSGGTLVVCASASGYTAAVGSLGMSIQVDGKPQGSLGMYANAAATHLCLVGNDLVVTGIPAGNHAVSLVAASGTVTDYNDRCSITVIEVATSWP